MALSKTAPAQAGDDFAIYNLQSTSIFPTVIFPNGANINNIALSDLISPQGPGFTDYSGDTIKSIEIDNASSLLLYFPLWGIYIQPFTTGYAQPVFPEQQTLWVQAILPRNIANTSIETVSIRLYSFQTPSKSPGAGNSGIVDSVVADNAGFFILSVYGSSAGQLNAQPNGLYVANGYDAINPDGATTGYVPARTPNVFVWSNLTLPAGDSGAVVLYTPPNGFAIRLMAYGWSIDADAIGDRFWLEDGAGNRLTGTDQMFYSPQVSGTAVQTFMPWTSFPNNGIPLPTNRTIKRRSLMNNAHAIDIFLLMYVGP